MGFMNWFTRKPSYPTMADLAAAVKSEPPPPLLGCPECSWKEAIPVREVISTDVNGYVEKVGNAVYCSRCLCQYVASRSGVYKSNPMPAGRSSEPQRPAPPEQRQLRDSDMANVWEGRRK